MSSYRAMKLLAEDAGAIRALVHQLLLLGCGDGAAWTDWEVDFLEHMATRESDEPLSMRQREVLTELKHAADRHTQIDGLNVRALIEKCWLERFDLSTEDDQAFVEDMKASGQRSVTGRQRARLLRCCRELGVIEGHHGVAA